jgi:microcystin-dependent protein
MFGGNFAPQGWAFCNGQILPISENDTLFNLIGTTYGGDGQETFALPNLQGRTPVHLGTLNGVTYQIGETGGVESVTLTPNQMPAHTHAFVASTAAGTTSQPSGQVLGALGAVSVFRPGAPGVPMNVSALAQTGGSQPHENMQPYLCINYIISLFGIYPSQN